MNQKPDVNALIHLNHVRRTGAVSGYRPAHRVKEDYLTTGVHKYTETEVLHPGESCEGTITFISPEAYPNCLYVGQVIDILEGGRIVGNATITKIHNKILERLE